MRISNLLVALAVCNLVSAGGDGGPPTPQSTDYPITPVPFTTVHFTDEFWAPRLETNRTVSLPYDFRKCEETGRIDNFLRAAHRMAGKYVGPAYNDSDVFKVVEGAAYSLALHADAKLEQYLDELITKFAAAQEADGYLYAARTTNPEDVQSMCGAARYSNERFSHELYNVGHMYEAAVAHFAATGRRNFLDIAIKSADHVDREFGRGKRVDPPGHEEIEIGLVKLYRATGESRYLRLAQFFLDCRGRNHDRRASYGSYAQDEIPVTQQVQPAGHAVRAMYLYSAMADVAALTGNAEYGRAIDRIWDNTVGRQLYLTGGLGARASGEAFGDDYELPNREAYAETCAAIGNALWNERMFLLHGDAKYLDVLERVLYNGFLSGVSLGGDQFFYVNPLASDGRSPRKAWFDCSCCPTNVVRFMPSIPGLVYARRGNAAFVCLFVAGTGRVDVGGQTVRIVQETKYPWQGDVRIVVKPEKTADFALHVRIPGWASGRPTPGDLYKYLDANPSEVRFSVNGAGTAPNVENGFAVIRRTWRPGDILEMHLPMPVRRVVAHARVKDDVGRAALERGPILYCVEAVDHGGRIRDLVLPDDAELTPHPQPGLLGGVTLLRGRAQRVIDDKSERVELTAVPYYAWCHRAPGEMAVWLARTPQALGRVPLPASASYVCEHDMVEALSDGRLPRSSGDQSIPRFTWWDRKGSREWVQYDFPRRRTVRRVEVYWFDDTGAGMCRVPSSWRLLAKVGKEWRALKTKDAFETVRDRFNAVTFEPVETDGLRIEVELQAGFSGGILEWRVE